MKRLAIAVVLFILIGVTNTYLYASQPVSDCSSDCFTMEFSIARWRPGVDPYPVYNAGWEAQPGDFVYATVTGIQNHTGNPIKGIITTTLTVYTTQTVSAISTQEWDFDSNPNIYVSLPLWQGQIMTAPERQEYDTVFSFINPKTLEVADERRWHGWTRVPTNTFLPFIGR